MERSIAGINWNVCGNAFMNLQLPSDRAGVATVRGTV